MRRTLARAVAVATCAVTLTTMAGNTGQAAPAAHDLGHRPQDRMPTEVLDALRRDLGLSPSQAATHLAQQAAAIEIDGVLRGRLGSAFGGSWFDTVSGKLVVGVTDARQLPQVTTAGATAKVVDHSQEELDGIMAELDAMAGLPDERDAVGREPVGRPGPAVAGLVSWRVDPATNSVVVTARNGQPRAAALDVLARHGDAVRVERTDHVPTTVENFMDGGDAIDGGNCSAGFNLLGSDGQGYLLTAGHCVEPGQMVTGHDGVDFGPVLESWFPGTDDALVRNDSAGYWIQGPWIDTNPSIGPVINVHGASDAPQETAVCKSGITTKLTCGKITAKDVTVVYDGVYTVNNLTQHTACVEKGDSGGANYSPSTTANTAEGVTSGAVLYGPALRCGSAVDEETISYYFPIVNSLGYYGPKYGLDLWVL
jgi:streptogrisin C